MREILNANTTRTFYRNIFVLTLSLAAGFAMDYTLSRSVVSLLSYLYLLRYFFRTIADTFTRSAFEGYQFGSATPGSIATTIRLVS